MTKEEIMAMKPGRELDILTQEEVLQEERDRYFHPSINMGDAWRVVEMLQQQGIYLSISMFADFMQVSVRNESGEWLFNVDEMISAPHAICIAALLAVMEVEK